MSATGIGYRATEPAAACFPRHVDAQAKPPRNGEVRMGEVVKRDGGSKLPQSSCSGGRQISSGVASAFHWVSATCSSCLFTALSRSSSAITGRREPASPVQWRRWLHRSIAEATQRSGSPSPGPDGHSAVQRAAVATQDPRYAASATASAGRNPKPPQQRRRGNVAWRHEVGSSLQRGAGRQHACARIGKEGEPASQCSCEGWSPGERRGACAKRATPKDFSQGFEPCAVCSVAAGGSSQDKGFAASRFRNWQLPRP